MAEDPLAPCRSRAREGKPQRKEGGGILEERPHPGENSAAKGAPRPDRRGGEDWLFSTELHPEVPSV